MEELPHHRYQGLLAHLVSYAPAIFFLVFLAGLILHINIPIRFAPVTAGWIIGTILMIIGPLLVLLAQRVRHTLYVPVEDRTCFNFNVGPYRWSRHPTYLGLFIMMFGFAFLIDSLPMLLLTAALAPFFTFIIIPKEEALLTELCEDIYNEYKSKVRMWF